MGSREIDFNNGIKTKSGTASINYASRFLAFNTGSKNIVLAFSKKLSHQGIRTLILALEYRLVHPQNVFAYDLSSSKIFFAPRNKDFYISIKNLV